MKLVRPLIVAVIQIVFFVAVYHLLFYAFEQIGFKSSSNIGWGISLRIGFYIFAVITLFINYLWVLKLSSAQKNGLLVFFVALFIVLWIKDIKHTPYKTALFLFCALLGFFSKYLIDRIIDNKNKAPN